MIPKVFLLTLLLVGVAVAQRPETESEGMKRILNPTLNPATSLQDKSFYDGADKGFATGAGQVKTFHWSNLFNAKTYTNTKSFDSPSYWTGEFIDGNAKARTKGNYSIPKADEKVEVKTTAVKEDRDAQKLQTTQEYAKSRPYLVPGKSQKILDSQQAAQTPLTVDDVRKILNTTK